MVEACYWDEFEPESWKEMENGLEHFKGYVNKLEKGFYLSDTALNTLVNYQFMEEESCAFCYVKRHGNKVVVKTYDRRIYDLYNKLLKLKRSYQKEEQIMKARGFHQSSFRRIPKNKEFYLKRFGHSEMAIDTLGVGGNLFDDTPEVDMDEYSPRWHFKLTVDWDLLKPLLRESAYMMIEDQKNLMRDLVDEFDDSPSMYNQSLEDTRDALQSQVNSIYNEREADHFIRVLKDTLYVVKEMKVKGKIDDDHWRESHRLDIPDLGIIPGDKDQSHF